MSECKTCDDMAALHGKHMTALQKIKDIARKYAKRENLKSIEIVKTSTGAYKWVECGQPRTGEHVEFLYFD